MYAEGASRSGIGQVEVEIENIVCRETGTARLEFFNDDTHQHVAAFQFAADNAEKGHHILLAAEFHTVVDLTVEMDGQVGNLKERTFHVEQQSARMHGFFTFDDDTSGEGERTVEPRGHDGSPVDFCVEFHHSALRGDFSLRLDAEGGRIAVGTDHVESGIGQCATAYLESKDGRIVFGDEETVTGLHLAKGFARVELAVASLCEGLGDVLHCEEIDG